MARPADVCPPGRRLTLLLRRADQEFIDGHVSRPRDDVGDGVADVRGLHPLDVAELLADRLQALRPVVGGQLGPDRSGLHHRYPHVTLRYLLTQRLPARAHAMPRPGADA